MLLPLIIGFQLNVYNTNLILIAADQQYVSVRGYAKVVSGNQMQRLKKSSQGPIPLEGAEVIAVSGSVKTINGQPIIPLKKISSRIIGSNTDKTGSFKFSLKPGLYTFFLVIDDKAYLNSYDGKGFFMGTTITSPNNDLLLLDDRNAIY